MHAPDLEEVCDELIETRDRARELRNAHQLAQDTEAVFWAHQEWNEI
jgi:hypothetical protein